MPDNPSCPACLVDQGQRRFETREMMFGTRERFSYIECAGCGSLRIAEVPHNLGRHYPDKYYAFSTVDRLGLENQTFAHRVKRGLRRAHMRHVLGRAGAVGFAARVVRRGKTPFVSGGIEDVRRWLRPTGYSRSANILDVGCGSGLLLWELHEAGLINLTGIEPYVMSDSLPAVGPQIFKRAIADATEAWPGRFDLVMLHHVFEHLPDPAVALGQLMTLVRPGGTLLIRLPVAGSFAWRTYGADWVQLDPPRHLFVPSERGLRELGGRIGLELESVEYDSTGFQIWASEHYQQDIPLLDERSLSVAPRTRAAAMRLAAYDEEARRLNASGDGDQAAFYFTRPTG